MANIVSCINAKDFEHKTIAKKLIAKFGHNAQKFHDLYNAIVNYERGTQILRAAGFNESISADEYANRLNDDSFAERLVEAATDWYHENVRDVDAQTKLASRDGFRHSKAESVAIRYMVAQVHEIYRELSDKGELLENPTNQIANEVYNRTLNTIANRWLNLIKTDVSSVRAFRNAIERALIDAGYDVSDFKNEKGLIQPAKLKSVNPTLYYQVQRQSILSVLTNSPSIQDQNLGWFFNELITDRDGVLDRVFKSPSINYLTRDLMHQESYNVEEIDLSDESEDTIGEQGEADDTDQSTKRWADTAGFHKNTEQHLDNYIKSLLSTIPKLRDSQSEIETEMNYNLSNPIGMPEYHSMKEINDFLFTKCRDCDNIEQFIAKLTAVASVHPGMRGLLVLANQLKKDKQLRYKFWKIYAKEIAVKVNTVIDPNHLNEGDTVVTNKESDPVSSLFYEYYQTCRNTLLSDISFSATGGGISPYPNTRLYQEWERNRSNVEEKIRICARVMKSIIPNLSEDVYIAALKGELKKEGKELNSENLLKLHNQISHNLVEFWSGNDEYRRNAKEHLLAAAKYKALNEHYKKAKNFSLANLMYDKYKNELSAVNKLQVAETEYLRKFCEFIAPYTPITSKLVSRNAKDKQTTDVMDSSMVSFMMKTLRNPYKLKQLGLSLSQSSQYQNSAILGEQTFTITNEQGKEETVRIPGFFKVNPSTGELELGPDNMPILTQYATELIQFRNFNGTEHKSTRDGAVKTDLSPKDYTRSLWTMFWKNKSDSGNSDGSFRLLSQQDDNFALYAMRTPSDSSKLWCVRAPKLDADRNVVLAITPGNDQATFNQCWRDVEDELEKSTGTVDNSGLCKAFGKTYKISRNTIFKEGVSKSAITKSGRIGISNTDAKQLISNGDGTYTVFVSDVIRPNKWQIQADGSVELHEVNVASEEGYQGETNNVGNYVALIVRPANDGYWYDVIDGQVLRPTDDIVKARQLASPSFQRVYAQAMFERNMQNPEYCTLHTRINRQTQLFHAFRSQALQEVINAAKAIHDIFETIPETGQVDITSGKWRIKQEYIDHPERLLELYHVKMESDGGSPRVGDIVKNGKLTGSVFTSSAFIGMRNGKRHNFGEEVWNRIFDFLNPAADGGTKALNFTFDENTGKVSLQLSDTQLAALDNMVADFMNTKVANEYEELNQTLDNSVTYEEAAKFVLNYMYFYKIEDELIDGDPKFYKNAQDFFKRAKEGIAGGIPFGIANYTGSLTQQTEDVDLGLGTEVAVPYRKNGEWTTKTVAAKTTYRAVTVQNTVRTTADTSNNPRLVERLVKGGLPKDKVQSLLKKYERTKTNDAQSYITMAEWIRRIAAMGKFDEYRELIEALNAKDEKGNWVPLTPNHYKAFVQVQKNFGYQLMYNSTFGLFIPSQIKNAEFVLIPRFIEDTDLQVVYDTMMELDIDQLNTRETDKAAKSDVLTLWNDEGNISQDNLDHFVERCKTGFPVKEYDYRFLYQQQETQQHMDAENKAGKQIMTKITDNILPDSDLNDLAHDFEEMYQANIEGSATEMMDNLEVTRDEYGNVVLNEPFSEDSNEMPIIAGLNPSLLFDMMAPHAMNSSNAATDQIRYFETDEFGNPIVPSYISSFASKMDNAVVAFVNKRVVRQTLPGFHAAQVTGVGFGYTLHKSNDFLKDNNRIAGFKFGNDGTLVRANKEDVNLASGVETYNINLKKAKDLGLNVKHFENEEEYQSQGNEGIDIAIIGSGGDMRIETPKYRAQEARWLEDTENNPQPDKTVFDAFIQARVRTSNQLRYHPDGESYIEVMIPKPKALAHLSDEEALRILNQLGVNDFIGYRIPTEGQQSISVMRVVKFLDQAQGSTIVVPDDWVAQTGADFDIDSIYAIMPSIKMKKDGTIYIDEFIENPTEDQLKELYMTYVERKLKSLDKKVQLNTFRKQYNSQRKEAYVELRRKTKALFYTECYQFVEKKHAGEKTTKELRDGLSDTAKAAVDAAVHEVEVSNGRANRDTKLTYMQMVNTLVKALKPLIETDESAKACYERYKEIRDTIRDGISVGELLAKQVRAEHGMESTLRDEKFAGISKLVAEINQNDGGNGAVESMSAASIRLMTFDEFKTLSPLQQNTKEGRSTRLFEIMRELLQSDESLAQQIQRSNFENIIEARDGVKDRATGKWIIRPSMSDEEIERRKSRSPYSVLTQIANNTDAMSGLKLKGISVSIDNFVSKCNHIRPVMKGFKTFYPVSRYKLEDIKAAFEDTIVENGNNSSPVEKKVGVETVRDQAGDVIGYIVTHNKFGWSKNNKNVAGDYITIYSSQTTAHQLDAIKEGAITNVTAKTFGVYKMFPSMGCDYVTAVSFMATPAVTEIVKRQNERDSIFADNTVYSNPVRDSALYFASKLGVRLIDENGRRLPLSEVFKSVIEEYGDVIKDMYGVQSVPRQMKDIYELPFNSELQLDRIRNEGVFDGRGIFDEEAAKEFERQAALFDFISCVQYRYMESVADDITSYGAALNVDSFGKGVTMWKIRNILQNIQDLAKDAKSPTMWVVNSTGEKVPLIRAVYPGIGESLREYLDPKNIQRSASPTLNAFLKNGYVMAYLLSTKVNDMNTPEIISMISSIPNADTNEDTYNEASDFLVSTLAQGTSFAMDDGVSVDNLAMRQRIFGIDSLAVSDKEVSTEPFYNVTTKMSEVISEAIDQLRGMYADELEKSELKENYEEFVDARIETIIKEMLGHVENMSEKEKQTTLLACKQFVKFTRMSPAQKVLYIKLKYRKLGLFDYLQVDSPTRWRQYSAVQMKPNMSIDDATNAFKSAFESEDAFVHEAALDLMRYVIYVEGRAFKERSINKCVPVECWERTGYVEQMRDKMRQAKGWMRDSSTGRSMADKFVTNYVRSHWRKLKLPKVNNYISEDRRTGEDVSSIVFGENETINLSDGANYERFEKSSKNGKFPNFITLTTYDKQGGQTIQLYKKFVSSTEEIIYFPLNDLAETESDELSMIPANNVWPSEKTYRYAFQTLPLKAKHKDIRKRILENKDKMTDEEIIAAVYELKAIRQEIEKLNSTANDLIQKQFSAASRIGSSARDTTPKLNFLNPQRGTESAVEEFRDQIFRAFSETGSENSLGCWFFQNSAVQEMFKGRDNSVVLRLSPQNSQLFLITAHNEKITPTHTKLDISSEYGSFGGMLREIRAYDPKLSGKHEYLTVEPITNSDLTRNEDSMYSSIDDIWDTSVTQMQRDASNGNQEAIKSLHLLHELGIDTKDTQSIVSNQKTVARIKADYIESRVKALIDKFDAFYPNPSNPAQFYAIDSNELMELLKTREDLRTKFLETILGAQALIDDVRLFEVINNPDDEIQAQINRITNAVLQLQKNPKLNNALLKFTNQVVASWSSDPLIQTKILTLMEGFENIGWFEQWISSSREVGNSLMQVIIKEFNKNATADEIKGRQESLAYREAVKKLREEAKSAGVEIDMSKIIDENGDWVERWDKSIREQYNNLRTAIDVAIQNNGIGSVEHVDAKLALDEFLLKHFNREASDTYYKGKINLAKRFKQNCPTLYYKYEGLRLKRNELYKHTTNGILDPAYRAEIDKIDAEIFNMKCSFLPNGSLRPTIDELFPTSVPNMNNPNDVKALEMSLEWSQELKNYIENNKKNESAYYERVADDSFYTELSEKLNIIRNAENRDGFGRIQTPAIQLAQNQRYLEAKKWVEENAKLVLKADAQDLISKAFSILKGNASGINKRSVYGQILASRKPYDSMGVVDGRQFTSEERKKMKLDLQWDIDIRKNANKSTDRLIRCGERDGLVYNDAFYEPFATTSTMTDEYRNLVRQINKILQPVYDKNTKRVATSHLTKQELKLLGYLYSKISEITPRHRSPEETQKMRDHIDANVDFNLDVVTWKRERQRILDTHDRELLDFWDSANSVFVDDGNGNTEIIPNSLLYGTMKPKGVQVDFVYDQDTGRLKSVKGNAVFRKFVDADKSLAVRTLSEYTERVKTQYYEEEYNKYFEESQRQNDPSIFQKWFEENHVYDSVADEYVPLPCWTSLNYKASDASFASLFPDNKNSSSKNAYYYDAKYNHSQRKVKQGKENPAYKKGNLFQNYKTGSGYDIDASRSLNPYEQRMKELMQNTIAGLAIDEDSKKYFELHAPARRRKEQESLADKSKKLLKTVASSTPFYLADNYEEEYQDDISMSSDRRMSMPMTSPIIKEEPLEKIPSNATAQERAEINTRNAQREANNAKAKAAVLDQDWDSVMEEFINRATIHNGLRRDRMLLYYLKHMVKQQTLYKVNAMGDVEMKTEGGRTKAATTDESEKANTMIDAYFRRRILNQFRKNQGAWTRIGKRLQNWSSAKYMMFNVTGGIANVTYGASQIFMENMLAHEYFDSKDAFFNAKKKAIAAAFDATKNFNSSSSTSLNGGLVKMFNVVDFDTVLGLAPNRKEDFNEIVRNSAYILQSGGEFLMQNGVLFAMLDSHRLVKNADGKLVAMTKSQYLRDADDEALMEVLAGNPQLLQMYDKYKANIENDVQLKKEFAYRKHNVTEVFVREYMSADKALFDKWKEQRAAIREKRASDFLAKDPNTGEDMCPTLYSQFELKDGYVDIKPTCKLKTEAQGDEIYRILGAFKNKVESVNQKIHGVYDKFGAAAVEQNWWGGVVMQYHKHMWPGIMKRFRRKGYYNESRESFEIGCYTQLWNFLKIEFTHDNFTGVPTETLDTMQTIQNYMKATVATISNMKMNWECLTDEQKGNLKRCLSDAMWFFSAVFCSVLLKLGFDDDDDENLWYNLAVYETDRLASESMMYVMPWSEAEKLWNSPVAAGSGINDLLSSMGVLSAMIMQGKDYDPTYQNGIHKGENKIKVQLLRQIPVYRSMKHLMSIPKNNKYYKLSTNWNEIFAKKIADTIEGEDE